MGMWLHTCEKKSIGLRRIQPLSLLAVANRLLTKCSYCSGDGFEITLRSRVLSISTFSCCVMCFGQGLRGCLLSRLGGFLLIVDPGQVHRRGDGSRRHGVHLGPATQGGLSEVYSTALGKPRPACGQCHKLARFRTRFYSCDPNRSGISCCVISARLGCVVVRVRSPNRPWRKASFLSLV